MNRQRLLLCAIGLLVLCRGLSAQQPGTLSLDDMEGDVAARWQEVNGTPVATLEPDEKTVKQGEQSGRWEPATGATQITLVRPDLPRDWTPWGGLEMWVHAVKPTGAIFAIVVGSDNPGTNGPDYYRCLIPVDWEGWRFLHLEPRGFCAGRTPLGWAHVDSLGFAIAGWSDLKLVPGTVLRFDAIRLVKAWASGERRLLFQPDTDWCAWWPLGYATEPVKTGRYVSEWVPDAEHTTVVNRSVPGDWSGMTHLNAWLHCEGVKGGTLDLTAVSDNPATKDTEAYGASVALDWVGWRLVSILLASFVRQGEPLGWQAIGELRLSIRFPAAVPAEARLCLDTMWLSPNPETEASWASWTRGLSGAGGPAPTIAAPGPGSGPSESGIAQLLKEALAAKRAGNLELAFTRYIAVLLQDEACADAHWGLAWVLAAKGEKEAAAEHFQKVVELSHDPKMVEEAKEALGRLR